MATSHNFEADLPELTEAQLEKLYGWGKSSCEAFDIRMNEDMSMILIATRKKQDSVRGHMRLLRTNLLNWGVSLPDKQMGWLRLVDEKPQSTDFTTASQQKITPRSPNPTALRLPENILTIPIVAR